MILEITLSSKSELQEIIKKERFYLDREENNILYFRKYIYDYYQCMIINKEIITHANNPKEYQKLWKLILRNKIDIEIHLCFSDKMKNAIAKMALDPKFSFCFSEVFEVLRYKNITLEFFQRDDFYFDYDVLYRFVDK